MREDVLLNLFGNFSFRTGYTRMRCLKSRYLNDFKLAGLRSIILDSGVNGNVSAGAAADWRGDKKRGGNDIIVLPTGRKQAVPLVPGKTAAAFQ